MTGKILDHNFTTEKSKDLIENGKKMVNKISNSLPPKPVEDRSSQLNLEAAIEVKDAAQSLRKSVEQLKLPILLTVGMLEKVLVWLKLTTILGTITLLVMLYAAVKITLAASISAETNTIQIALFKKLEDKLKVSPEEILDKIEKKEAENEAKEKIAAAERPKIEAGKDGRVAIVIPQKLSPERKQEIQKKVTEARLEGRSTEVETKAVQIEVDLK